MGNQPPQPVPPDQIGLGLPGARINQTYLVRTQRSVAVNEADLEELLTFDVLQQALMALGIFMLSGAVWLGIEKVLEQDVFQFTPLIALCATASVFGTALLVVGLVLFKMRRRKVRKIFTETEEV